MREEGEGRMKGRSREEANLQKLHIFGLVCMQRARVL